MKLDFVYDEFTDVLTIEGVPYSGEFFRSLGKDGLELNKSFRVVERREDGVIAIQTFEDEKPKYVST